MGLIIIFWRLFLLTADASPLENEIQARLLPRLPDESHINGLSWDNSDQVDVQIKEAKRGKFRYVAVVKGHYRRPDWTLLLGQKKLVLLPEGDFTLEIPIEQRETDLTIMAFSGKEKMEEERRTILAPGLAPLNLERDDKEELNLRKLYFTANAEVSNLAFKQTSVSGLNEVALRVQASGFYRLIPDQVELNASVFYTGLPVVSTLMSNLTFLGVNVMAGYLVPQIKAPWHLNLMAGMYYLTSYDSNNNMGYADINGPELLAKLLYSFRGGQVASVYLKFAGIMNGFNFLSPDSGEYGMGGKYSFAPSPTSGNSFGITLDVSIFNLAFQDGTIQNVTETLGFCYNF
jgi:hypothetical protein